MISFKMCLGSSNRKVMLDNVQSLSMLFTIQVGSLNFGRGVFDKVSARFFVATHVCDISNGTLEYYFSMPDWISDLQEFGLSDINISIILNGQVTSQECTQRVVLERSVYVQVFWMLCTLDSLVELNVEFPGQVGIRDKGDVAEANVS
ncbi:hypothetical protein T265_03196 [Opisthorchis viverrini]|uniref:Uncharacterized protein n=1 Tax=Opisthorchis viverrini TaxID=6198 RepID=A0A075AHR7_OPIVI|nr:hypothetical protein T265_03196 [Opisthorchis viverrini]KER30354.1 hypothetical protein T265_03196 [Opisthorchis viverrini]